MLMYDTSVPYQSEWPGVFYGTAAKQASRSISWNYRYFAYGYSSMTSKLLTDIAPV